jgi:hypothetical protein
MQKLKRATTFSIVYPMNTLVAGSCFYTFKTKLNTEYKILLTQYTDKEMKVQICYITCSKPVTKW